MRNKKNQRGMGVLLLEVVIAMSLSVVLMSMTVVPFVRLRASQQTEMAKNRLRQVQTSAQLVALCSIPQSSCSAAAVAGLVPPPGTITTSGHVYTFIQIDANTWSLEAHPQALGATGVAGLYISNSDGILRCNYAGTATATSGPC